MTQKLFKILKPMLMIGVMVMLFALPASASTKTSVKILKVGESYTIKNTSKVKSSKTGIATAKKKSGSKYKITGKKKGTSTLTVYNKKGKPSQKVYLLVYNGKTFKYNTDAINLAKGKTKTVTASTNMSKVTIKYKSSDTSIATVNSKGKITAKKAGKTTIKALFYYKGTKVKTLKKTVNVYTSSYNTDSITMTVGNTKTVSASVSSNCSAKYSSSDTSVATVNSSGKITAKKKGTATITCKVYLGSTNVKTYTKKVTVNAKSTSTSSSSGSSSSSTSSTSTSSSSSSSSTSSFKNHVTTSGTTTIAGGQMFCMDVYCEKASDVVSITAENGCVLIRSTTYTTKDSTNGGATAYVTGYDIYGQVEGTCTITIKVNGSTLKTVTATVTSTDTSMSNYETWKPKVQNEIWNSSMTNLEKVASLCDYVWNNYEYYTYTGTRYAFADPDNFPGADCYGVADLVIDFVKDLGGTGTIEQAYGSTTTTHVWANITIDGETYYVDVWNAGAIYNSSKKMIYATPDGWY